MLTPTPSPNGQSVVNSNICSLSSSPTLRGASASFVITSTEKKVFSVSKTKSWPIKETTNLAFPSNQTVATFPEEESILESQSMSFRNDIH